MNRREFLRAAALLGLLPFPGITSCSKRFSSYSDLLPVAFGDVSLLHFTDSHAQLLPVHYREPDTHIGVGRYRNAIPHLVGQSLLNHYGIALNTTEAHAFTHLNFTSAARRYGKMGGYAHLATLINQLRNRSNSDNTLLLDGGDSWQGSATALWTRGQDMVEASNLLGVDVMTGHWEFTYGQSSFAKNLADFNGQFLAQNISVKEEAWLLEEENPLPFEPYTIRSLKNARVAIIGQAFPYTPIANPKRFMPDWQFGIEETRLQTLVATIKDQQRADVIVLLSHNGLEVDLKLASRISGIDVILGGHTHDALPRPIEIANPSGTTLVTNAGSHGKFLAVLDIKVKSAKVVDYRYHLLPVFSDLIPPDQDVEQLIKSVRRPYLTKLTKTLAVTDQLLYRRGTFEGTFDQLILQALLSVTGAEIAFSPGFRWGTAVLSGQSLTVEDIFNQTAITYPEVYVSQLSGLEIKHRLEDICDNLFNHDPYLRQGGDMVRVMGITYLCDPEANMGQRISHLRRSNGALIDATKLYSVAGWASTENQPSGRPIWDLLFEFLKDKQSINFDPKSLPDRIVL